MTPAEYAAMADPERNRHFLRGRDWPPPLERKRRPQPGAAHLNYSGNLTAPEYIRSTGFAQRRERLVAAAEEIFAPAGAR
jgi:hypothetical protein